MVEEDVKVEAVGGVALEESVQEIAQLGRGSARNPERNDGANGTVILVGGCVSVSTFVPHFIGPFSVLDT